MLPVLYALSAAVLYALSTPFSKLLLASVPETYMAAFLYLGAGVGMGILYLFTRKKEAPDEKLTLSDLPYTVSMVLLDIAAPILLMTGIKSGTASNISLLNNFEIVFTSLIALLFFRERISARLWAALGLITAGGIILSFTGGESLAFSRGSLFAILATACWGLENNCTRRLSARSACEIVTVKGLGSGCGSLLIAATLGESFPPLTLLPPVLLLGFVAYGLSIFLYVRAQRSLGAARTGAFYSAAPFVSALICLALLREPLSRLYPAALLLMLIGSLLTVRDTLKSAGVDSSHAADYNEQKTL